MKLSYELVTGEQWEALHKAGFPNAVHNAIKTEYILTHRRGGGDLTRKQAQDYIDNNWTQEAE